MIKGCGAVSTNNVLEWCLLHPLLSRGLGEGLQVPVQLISMGAGSACALLRGFVGPGKAPCRWGTLSWSWGGSWRQSPLATVYVPPGIHHLDAKEKTCPAWAPLPGTRFWGFFQREKPPDPGHSCFLLFANTLCNCATCFRHHAEISPMPHKKSEKPVSAWILCATTPPPPNRSSSNGGILPSSFSPVSTRSSSNYIWELYCFNGMIIILPLLHFHALWHSERSMVWFLKELNTYFFCIWRTE